MSNVSCSSCARRCGLNQSSGMILDDNITLMCVRLPPFLPTLDIVVVVVDMVVVSVSIVVVACQSNCSHDCICLVVMMVA